MVIGGFSGRAARDACPGALQVHVAADGALARVRVPGGALTTDALRELAACAGELGNGVIELTSRANVQVRGLADPAAFAARMAAAGLLPSATHERVRNIVASPLSGRFLFALDDGTGDVLGLGADVTLAARPGRPVDHLGGDLTLLLAGEPVRSVTAGDAVAVALAAAEAFQSVRGDAWRVAELPGGPATIAARLPGAAPVAVPVTVAAAEPRKGGVFPQADGRVAVDVIVPLGRLTPAQADLLAGLTPAEVRLTPWRTVVLPDLAPGTVGPVADSLVEAGLVIDPASPYARLSACTGRPGCAKALADVRADAARWAETGTPELPDGPIHWAGCERRCGRPRGHVADVVATPGGYRVSH